MSRSWRGRLRHAGARPADNPPPRGAKPLTELLQSIEKRADFGYIDEVERDNGAEYYTKAGMKKKVYIDPANGNPRPQQPIVGIVRSYSRAIAL